jgi:CheY-like chemotaxis protein
VGKGTGLGLAIVYGIVKQSGGHVTIRSEPGRGTTVVMYFPRLTPRREVSAPAPPQAPAERGSATILLVEDEDGVRRVATRILEARGYVVLAAADGEEARTVARMHAGRIDLLLTDVVMPRLGGPELARELTAIEPSLRTLFASGHAIDEVERRGIVAGEGTFLHKPYTPDALAAAVRRALDAPLRDGREPAA